MGLHQQEEWELFWIFVMARLLYDTQELHFTPHILQLRQTPRYKKQQTHYFFTSPFAATPELE